MVLLSTELATSAPAGGPLANAYGDYGSAGFEGVTAADVALPYLSVLQALSPEVSGDKDQKVKGAEAGSLFNTVTREVYDPAGVIFVPVSVNHVFVEWRPRTSGGGFVGVHPAASEIVEAAKAASKDFGKYKTENGNDLAETYYVLGLIHRSTDLAEQLPMGTGEPILVTFQSTKITAWKKFMYRLLTFIGRPPLFAHRLRITTVQEKNTKGTFYNFQLTGAVNDDLKLSLIPPKLADGTPNPLLLAGLELNKAFGAGKVNVNYAGADKGTGSGGAGGTAEADIPF